MANPMEFAASSADEIRNIEQLFSGINSQALVKGFEKMTSRGTNKLKLLLGGKSATPAHDAITIRFTPQLHKEWLGMIGENATSKAANPTDVKKRASGEFATAFKDGKLVIEVKQGNKRTLYASKETAANMSSGNLKFKKNGSDAGLADYTFKVIDHDGFVAIANSFMTNLQNAQEPAATLTSDAIAATSNDATLAVAPEDTAQAQFMVQKNAEKRVAVNSPATKNAPKSKNTEAAESLEAQEKSLEAERAKQDVALAKKREHERAEVTTEAQEQRQEEIKHQETKVETTKDDTKVLDAIKAEEEAPLAPDETVS